MKPRIVAVLIAFNAETTLERFYRDFPRHLVDDIILIDDASKDRTFEIAQQLQMHCYRNSTNLGYGGNLKKIMAVALNQGADILIDIHPDGEYKTDAIPLALEQVRAGAEFVIGNRFTSLTAPLSDGMFFWKLVPIALLNALDRLVLGVPVHDLHQGFRVYSRSLLEKIDFEHNSNGYLFSFELIAQAAMAGIRIAEVPVQTSYTGRKRGASLRNSITYSMGTFRVLARYLLARAGWRLPPFEVPSAAMDARVTNLLQALGSKGAEG